MSDALRYSDDEFFAAIRPHGSLDVVVVARGRNEDAVTDAAFAAGREAECAGGRGRFYFGCVPAGLDEGSFAQAVIAAVSIMDLNTDGEVAGEYRIAA